VAGGIFDPAAFYGDTELWSVSLGFRIRTGMQHHRMGRYGVAATEHAGASATANLRSMGHH
jgi:hypothetical protein